MNSYKVVWREWSGRLFKQLKSPHPWLLVVLLGLISVALYSEQLGIFGGTSLFWFLGLSRHALERILFLVPILYAGIAIRPGAGLVASLAGLAIMLPHAIVWSSNTADAVLETLLIAIIGVLLCFYLKMQMRIRQLMRVGMGELEEEYQEFQVHLRLLEKNQARLSALNEISSVVTQSLDLKEVLSTALEKVAAVMNVEVVLIYLVDHETAELELLAHKGVSQELVAVVDRMKVGEGFNGAVAALGQAMVVEDTSSDPRLSREEVRREGLYAQLIVPMRFKGTVIGTLCVAVHHSRHFYPDEIELLTTIGNAIGVALENARLYEEQRRTAAELEVSERSHRVLFECANDAIWVQDLKGNIMRANQAAARLFGSDVETLKAINVRSVLKEDGLEVARRMRKCLLNGDAMSQPYEQRLVRGDGTEVVFMLTTNLVTSDGQPVGFEHIARDVTEEKRMQENMRFYIQQAVRAQEEERRRIARELHDDTAQVLGSLSRQLDNFIRKRGGLSPDDIFFLKDLQVQLHRGFHDVHRFSQDLRPSVLDDLGLMPALRTLVRETRERTDVRTELVTHGSERRFAPEIELLIFRIVQEALSNVRAHAQASEAQVVIDFTQDKTRVTVSDNGRGFELPCRVDDLPRSGKLGLAGMQERIRLLGGTMGLRSAPGQGTTLTVNIPY